MRIILTGSSGSVGTRLAEDLSGSHELVLMDRRGGVNERRTLRADLSRRPRGWWGFIVKRRHWATVFARADVIVHLAANPAVSAPWKSVLADNIQATWNVLEAAAEYRVPRVVFASSNWAVRALENKLAPDCYREDGPKIGSEAGPLPLTAYGLSKAFGETAGRMFVDEGKLETFVAVRIGHYGPSTSARDFALWIGTPDLQSLFRRCIEAHLTGFHVVYGVSAQATAPYDLSYTRRALSWSPLQTSENYEN